MASTLFNVEAYVTETALPTFDNGFGVTRSFSQEYADYKTPQTMGTRGPTCILPLPTRTRTIQNDLTFDATDANSGLFVERQFSLTVQTTFLARFQFTDPQSAVYKAPGIITKNAASNINEMSNSIEQYNIAQVSTAGYRWYGDPLVTGSLQSTAQVDEAVNTFQSFGCPQGSRAYFVLPYKSASNILQTAYQQFVIKRNDELALKGEMGMLGGVENTMFMKSNLLGVYIAGTASTRAVNNSTGYTIDSITVNPNATSGNESDNTTSIALSGLTAGDTVNAGDLLDIGFTQEETNPIRYLTFTGYAVSDDPVRCQVLTGGTADGSGELTITVRPALVYDATHTSVIENLSRAIIPGTDTVRFVKSHRRGLLYFGDYMYFLSPDLPDMDPFKSASVRSDLSGISMRAYYGAVLGGATKQFVHDAYIGSAGASEGIASLIFPLN